VQLQRYPQHLQLRQANATYLAQLLASVEGVTPLPHDQRVTANAYHIMFLRYQEAAFGGMPKATFIAALHAEGITGVQGGYSLPAYQQPVMQAKNFGLATPPLFSGVHPQPPDYRTVSHPVTERACAEEAIWIRHNMLLGERRDMEDIVEAIRKIQRHHDELRW
jgi:L-glutamine:2-deoxy-scyllo-inosose/3-amino-2,3-dideoxy-scyllo-inosose aminotransferase